MSPARLKISNVISRDYHYQIGNEVKSSSIIKHVAKVLGLTVSTIRHEFANLFTEGNRAGHWIKNIDKNG